MRIRENQKNNKFLKLKMPMTKHVRNFNLTLSLTSSPVETRRENKSKTIL